jgi:hypothetical protein
MLHSRTGAFGAVVLDVHVMVVHGVSSKHKIKKRLRWLSPLLAPQEFNKKPPPLWDDGF